LIQALSEAEQFAGGPQALKRWFIFDDVTAGVELVPFPFVMNSDFFQQPLEAVPFQIRGRG